jgi:photosystem II stability/assembly factor-like uncharacterized protein
MYATVDAGDYGGLYRSDDGGENWKSISNDGRYWGRGSDFAEIKADPRNEDIVYTANVVVWKSIDGGNSWKDFRGAPGGDDYHRIWIDPGHPNIILIAADQGAIITVNGGETFSSWYNQPTAQFYHVSADNAYPYNVYGGQQESGSVGIATRGNDGQITFREWHPVAAEEYGYVAADPLDPNIIYGGKLTRYDKRTGQAQNIAPEAVRSGKFRFLRTAPVLFSPIDPKSLYYAGNVLFRTRNGGHSWDIISPDLSRESWDIPGSVGIYASDELKKMNRRGVIYTVAPSPKNINIIWCGTDDGYIQLTKDGGKNWKNVTPPPISSWSKISMIEASHFDPVTAYAAVNRIRCDDMHPHIYKTNDGGTSWKEIVTGLPEDPINSVKEDPHTKGLLFAASERATYVSFDEGENWQSLQLNMPCTSIRDLIIKDDDIVVATHGRSFWILDDITPLRQLVKIRSSPDQVILFKPQSATRVRWNTNPDTPLPQEEPAGQNPPDGAIIDYFLKEKANGLVTLEIKDSANKLIRVFRTDDKPYPIPAVNIPLYWIRPQQILSADAGSHRFLWDLHYAPVNEPPSYPIAAIFGNTAPVPTSPWAMPGKYSATLTVNGKSYTQFFVVKMDPRVKTPTKDLKEQHDLSLICYQNRMKAASYLEKIQGYKKNKDTLTKETEQQLSSFSGNSSQPRRRDRSAEENFASLGGGFDNLLHLLEETDTNPTEQAAAAVQKLNSLFLALEIKWLAFESKNFH